MNLFLKFFISGEPASVSNDQGTRFAIGGKIVGHGFMEMSLVLKSKSFSWLED
jgi:hypothetical protein